MASDATKRMHYFDRQFMRAKDLQDEQDYHVDRRRRHNAGFHSSGVVQGLDVVAAGANQVNISAGWAVDALGQEIVLAAPRKGVPTGGSAVAIWIAYPQPEPLSDPSADAGVTGSTRVSEEPVVTVLPSGTVPANALQLATVSAAGVIDNTVRLSAGLKDGMVSEPKLANNAVSNRTIQNGAVNEPKLTNNAVSNRTIQNGAVNEPKLTDTAVSTRTIQNGAVNEPKLADTAVSTRTIQNAAVTEPKLADNAISTRTIQNAAVTEPKLADNAVSTRTIQNGAMNEPKLADDAVSARTIQDGAVSIAQLSAKLVFDQSVTVPPGELAITIPNESGDEHAFYLISVRFANPLTTGSFEWKQRVALSQSPPLQHVQRLIIQNPDTQNSIKVSCKVYKLAEK